jgi:hypothetical protein
MPTTCLGRCYPEASIVSGEAGDESMMNGENTVRLRVAVMVVFTRWGITEKWSSTFSRFSIVAGLRNIFEFQVPQNLVSIFQS